MKMILTFFIAGQIRATTRFITGEEIIGTILWGWYITKNNNIRTSRLVGTMATLSVISGIVTLVFGLPFMLVGQFYLLNVFGGISPILGDMYSNSSIIMFFVLSWGGFLWILIDKIIRVSIIYSPPAHYLYNKIYTKIVLFKKSPNVFENMKNREFSILSLKSAKKNSLLQKDRMIRLSLMILISVMIEALELIYIFNIVEMYNTPIDPVMHYNFFQISGTRYMVSGIRHFPVVNIMPGDGLLFIELFMSHTYEALYVFSHLNSSGDISAINLDSASKFAMQTTFITRFFNTYLQRIVALIITLFVVGKLINRKNREKHKVL